MPTINRRHFVPEAIRLFLAQDYPKKELLVLDNGEDSIADLIPNRQQIRYLRLDRRQSLGATRNLACSVARGEIIAHWDDDDWYAPWRLSRQVAEIVRGGADICGIARMLFFDPAAQRGWEYTYPAGGGPWVYGATFCYRKSMWQQRPFLDISTGEDNFFLANLPATRVRVLPETEMYVGLIHEGNSSPKRTKDPLWRPRPLKRIRRVVGSDWRHAPRRATGLGTGATPVSMLAASLGAASMVVGTLPVSVAPAFANPKGGQVMAGSATIASPTPTQLTVTQTTNRAAIDWQSFNIAAGERTSFVQPSAAAWTLNRVNAADPSVIAGRLTSNGSLVLINPNGILFSKGSQVDVHSLIATPSDISNANFMAGHMKFDKPPSNPAATVVNQGTITVAQRGLAALVAPGVENAGLIQAKLGKVVLAGAETFAVDFYGDGLFSFEVGSPVKAAPIGPDGKPMTSFVSNTGRINAPGGTVLLTADAVAGILENVVDMPGTIMAHSAGQTPGSVTVDAGPAGAANLAGRIDVSGLKPGQIGGLATVTGNAVRLASTARVKARANAGGGTVRIGGGPHGQDPTVRNAATTLVATGAVIDASATGTGNGGQVTIWSDQAAQFAGTIKARGGPKGGDGGWIETSGHALTVGDTALIDASAARGANGTWLLDPADVTIVNGNTCSGVSCSPPTVSYAPNGTSPSTIGNQLINNALNNGTGVTITNIIQPTDIPSSSDHFIAVQADLIWSSKATLTLSSSKDIFIGSNTSTDGKITGISGSLDLNVGLVKDGLASQFQPINVANLNVSGSAILNNLQNTVGTVFFSGTGGFSLTTTKPSGPPVALVVSGISAGSPTAQKPISLRAGQPVQITGPIVGSDVSLSSVGSMTVGSNITATGGISIGVAGGGGSFTNQATIKSTGSGPAGDIVVLADSMVLTTPVSVPGTVPIPGSAIVAGPNSAVVLGPFAPGTPTEIAGANSPPGVAGHLRLTDSELGTVTAGLLQIGYFTETGNIDVTSPITINAGQVPNFVLTTGGGVSGTGINYGGNIGTIAGNSVALGVSNGSTVAGVVNNPSQSFLFNNNGSNLTVGSLAVQQVGVSVDSTTNFPVASTTGTGSASNPVSGVTTANGDISIGVPGSGNLVLASNVKAGAANILLRSSNSITETNGATITASGLSVVADVLVGVVALDDANLVTALSGSSGGTFKFTNSQGLTVGSVPPVLGVATPTGVRTTSPSNIRLQTTTGDLTLAQNVSVDQTPGSNNYVALVAAGNAIEAGGSVTAAGLIVDAGGSVTFDSANAIGTLAGSAGNSFQFVNGNSLSIGLVPLIVDVGPQAGVATSGGAITLNTGASRLTVSSPLLSTGTISLTADTMSLGAQIGGSGAGAGHAAQVNLAPSTAGRAISLGAGAATGLALSDAELNEIRSTDVAIGSPAAGALTFDGAFTASPAFGTDTGPNGFSLTTGSNAEVSSGPFTLQGGFSINAGTTITLNTSISTPGAQSYTDTVLDLNGTTYKTTSGAFTESGKTVLTEDVVVDTSAGNQTIAFQTPGTIDGGQTLTLRSGGGAITIGGAVGGTAPLTSLAASGGTVALGGAVMTTGPQTLTQTGPGVTLTLAHNMTSPQTVALTSAGTIDQTGGVIEAGTLTGSSSGTATLAQPDNLLTNLGMFSTNNGDLTLTNGRALNIAGPVDAGTGMVTLQAGGALQQTGKITAQNLVARTQLDSGAAITLTNSGNAVPGNVTLSALNTAGTAPASGAIDFVDSIGFTVAAQPASGLNGQEIGINTTANVTLQAGGRFLTTAGGASKLAVSGSISSGAGLIGLAAGTGGILISGSIASTSSSPVLALFSTGPISESAAGSISVPNLVALTENNAGAPIILTSAGNRVNAVSLSTLNGPGNSAGPAPAPGSISFADSKDFQIFNVTATGGLASAAAQVLGINPSSNTFLSLAGQLFGINTSGDALLTSTSTITEQPGGRVTAGRLTGSSVGGASFAQPGNMVTNLGSFSTSNGDFALMDGQALNLTGVLNAGTGSVALTSTGTITEQPGGMVTAATLTGASVGAASFARPGNMVTNLGSFSTGNGDFALMDGQALNLTGVLNVGIGSVALTSTGTITEQSGGMVTAATLTGSSVGAASFTQPGNMVTNLGSFSTGNGDFALMDGQALNLAGPLNAGSGSVALTSTGAITEQPGSLITASRLFAGADGAVNLDTVANAVGVLSGKAGTGSFRFLNADPLTIGVVGPQSGVMAGQDIVIQTDSTAQGTAGAGALNISANMSAGGNLLVTSHGSLTVNGNVDLAAGKNIVLDSNGPFKQSGVLTVSADPPALVIDTTDTAGTGAQALLTTLLSSPFNGASDTITTPKVVNALPPSTLGPPSNPISFENLQAGGSVVVLIGNSGAINGTTNVGQLGLSDAGASSQLTGSIGGNSTPSAAQLAVLAGGVNGQYLFNGCPIGGAGCTPFSITQVLTNSLDILAARAEVIESIISAAAQQSQTQVDILLSRPREFDRFTGRPQDEDIDASIINIFDEERLCEEMRLKSPEAAREVCR